eukprot:maker-scaffold234_size243041-snap-gene-1.28 protein:Tk10943 transcript:maker-scaffold234_size243041-snap-gene-1.28-mRNA-1 annotation:"hypothetical protein EAG_00300"
MNTSSFLASCFCLVLVISIVSTEDQKEEREIRYELTNVAGGLLAAGLIIILGATGAFYALTSLNASRRQAQDPSTPFNSKNEGKRLERCQKILGFLKRHGSTVKIISDKKIFTVDQVYNRRNDRFIAGSPEEVKGVFRTKHPAQVMVMGVLASDGKKMPPNCFRVGEKIGANEYYKVLSYTVLPWLKAQYPEDNNVWTQDGAPSHTSVKHQKSEKHQKHIQLKVLKGNGVILPEGMSPDDVSKMKFCPTTSVDVERSFSQYKNILSDRRHSFTKENIKLNEREDYPFKYLDSNLACCKVCETSLRATQRSQLLQHQKSEKHQKHIQLKVLKGNGVILPEGMSPDDVSKMKFCPTTSVDVERSFSQYKNILSDRRHSFTKENIRPNMVTLPVTEDRTGARASPSQRVNVRDGTTGG